MPVWMRPGVRAVAAGVLLGLLVWFGAGRQLGLTERVLAGAEAVWPLAVVLACRWSQSRARMRRKSRAGADIQGSVKPWQHRSWIFPRDPYFSQPGHRPPAAGREEPRRGPDLRQPRPT